HAGIDQVPSSPAVKRYLGKGLVHRYDRVRKPSDPPAVADSLFNSVTKDNTHIFDSMVLIDIKVSGRCAGKIKSPMLCHADKHMIKEGDSCFNRYVPGTIRVDRKLDFCFFCFPC